jgi:hypothetical protein
MKAEIIVEIWRRIHIEGKDAGYWQARGLKMKPILSALDEEGRPRAWVADASESEVLWPELKAYIRNQSSFISTFFTDEERLSAEWCILRGSGIVRPNAPLEGYWSRNYYQDICPVCGSGWTQISPFRLERPPKLGRNAFASFAGDELFASNEVLAEFKAQSVHGVQTWPILIGEAGHPALGVEQILVKHVAEPAIADELVEHEHYRWTDCPRCGRRWHLYYNRGMLPLRRTALHTDVDFQMTHEWFGSGRAARREILVSNHVVRLILTNQWKGADLSPVQVV